MCECGAPATRLFPYAAFCDACWTARTTCKKCGYQGNGLVPRPEGGKLCIPCSQAAKLCELCPKPGTRKTSESYLCDDCYGSGSAGVRLFSVRGYQFAEPLEGAVVPWCGPRSNLVGWKEREYANRGNG